MAKTYTVELSWTFDTDPQTFDFGDQLFDLKALFVEHGIDYTETWYTEGGAIVQVETLEDAEAIILEMALTDGEVK